MSLEIKNIQTTQKYWLTHIDHSKVRTSIFKLVLNIFQCGKGRNKIKICCFHLNSILFGITAFKQLKLNKTILYKFNRRFPCKIKAIFVEDPGFVSFVLKLLKQEECYIGYLRIWFLLGMKMISSYPWYTS